jgi:hypothetical protein
MEKYIFKMIRVLFCKNKSKLINDLDEVPTDRLISKNILNISGTKVVLWFLILFGILDASIIFLAKAGYIENFGRSHFMILIIVEVIILCFVILSMCFIKKTQTNQYIVKKQIKSARNSLKKYCFKNNLSMKKLARFIILGDDTSSVSDLLCRWHHTNVNERSLFNAVNLWFSKKAITYDFIQMDSNNIEFLLKELKNRKENAVSGIIVTMSCVELLNTDSHRLLEYTEQICKCIKNVNTYFLKRIPVYFIFTNTNKIIGVNVFMKELSVLLDTDVLGHTTKQKNDDILDYSEIYKGIDCFVDELDNLRENILSRMTSEKNNALSCDDATSLFFSVSKLKNVIGNFKIILSELEEKFKESLLIFPFRGFYFTETSEPHLSTPSSKPSEVLLKPGTDKINGNVKHSLKKDGENIFNSNFINELILREAKTVRPLYKSYFKIKSAFRIVFSTIILLFLALTFYTYIDYISVSELIKHDLRLWAPVFNAANWRNDVFPPVMEMTYKISDQEVQKSQKKIKNVNNKLNSLLTLGKLENGTPVIKYFEEIFKLSKEYSNLPSTFMLYSSFDKISISYNYYEAVSTLFSFSFKIPVYMIALKTYLFNAGIEWDSNSYDYLKVILKSLNNMDKYVKVKGLFDKIGRSISEKDLKFNPILNFIFKNNLIDKELQIKDFFSDEKDYEVDYGTKDYYYKLVGTHKNMKLYENLKETFKIENNLPLEYMIIERFEELLKFPLSHGDFDVKHSTKYDDVIKANILLKSFDYGLIENYIKTNNINDDLLKKIKLAKRIGESLENITISKKNNIFLQNHIATERKLKNTYFLNGSKLFVCAKLQSEESTIDIKSQITRKDSDIYLGDIPINEYYPYNLKLYTSYDNARKNIPSCVLDLPNEWTCLYLLFNGPETMPSNYEYPYWATWDAAEYKNSNIWETKIIIKGDLERAYCFYLKFQLDPKLANIVLSLNRLYPKNTKYFNQKNKETMKCVINKENRKEIKNEADVSKNMLDKKLNKQTKGE